MSLTRLFSKDLTLHRFLFFSLVKDLERSHSAHGNLQAHVGGPLQVVEDYMALASKSRSEKIVYSARQAWQSCHLN